MIQLKNPFRYFDLSPKVIRLVVMMRAMLRFRQMKTLQKFSSVHAAFHNHFNQERHLVSRNDYKV